MKRITSKRIQSYLTQHEWALVIWAGTGAFLSYCCMYMYRKPYTAATFEGEHWGLSDYKIALVIAQVIGYAISKFAGIKYISELNTERRSLFFLSLIVWAELALVGFALSPPSWGIIWLFLNGLPLGLIWGIVFSYLEGRKWTEVLTVLISANFIFSSGLAKTIGQSILNQGIGEQLMPMLVGLLFFPLLLVSIWMLMHIPTPSDRDLALRSKRNPMEGPARKQFFKKHAGTICLFIAIYLLLTLVRDVRDNFAVEIWTNLGFGGQPEIFVTTEIPIAILAFVLISATGFIKNNQQALNVNLLLTGLGGAILIGTTGMFQHQLLSPIAWMIISGAGLFIPYILFNGVVFDRYIGTMRVNANVGFLMYSADAIGYLGSVGILLWRNLGAASFSWLNFYTSLCYWAGVIILILSLSMVLYINILRFNTRKFS